MYHGGSGGREEAGVVVVVMPVGVVGRDCLAYQLGQWKQRA